MKKYKLTEETQNILLHQQKKQCENNWCENEL